MVKIFYCLNYYKMIVSKWVCILIKSSYRTLHCTCPQIIIYIWMEDDAYISLKSPCSKYTPGGRCMLTITYIFRKGKKKEKQGANSSVLIKASKLLAIKTEKEIKVPPVHISILVSVPSDVPAEYVRVYAWVERLTYNNILLVLISLFFWKKRR